MLTRPPVYELFGSLPGFAVKNALLGPRWIYTTPILDPIPRERCSVSSTRRNRFPKSDRLLRPGDFTRVLKSGHCVADGVLVMFAVQQEQPGNTRLGVTVSRRTGNAVTRNRWKRWIRESFRTQGADIPAGLDLVIRPKKDAVAEWDAIRRSVPARARRAATRLRT